MSDQMASLRHLLGARRSDGSPVREMWTNREAQGPITLAIASGKGGVGKTLCAAHLAVGLARAGSRTLLVEGNLHMANLHLLFTQPPTQTGSCAQLPALSDLLRRDVLISDFLVSPREHLEVLTPAAMTHGESTLAEIYFDRVLSFARSTAADYQFLIVDTASGMPPENYTLLHAVDGILLLSTPEIASITDAYAFVKLLHSANVEGEVVLLPSMVSTQRDAKALHDKFNLLVEKFLRRRVQTWGHLPFDARLPAAIAQGKLLWDTAKRTPYLTAMVDLVDTLIGRFAEISGAQLHVAG